MVRFQLRWALLVMICGGAFSSARATDNVLGLPTPRDPRHPGAIVLHGGGRCTRDILTRFVELAGGREARIVLVPCAGYRAADYDDEQQFLGRMKSRFGSWVALETRGDISSFQFLYTDDDEDADDPDFIEPLESATGVWFCGGMQSRLNYRFVGQYPEQTQFQIALRGVVERGGVVGGTSAGMAALPEVITLWQDREHEDAPASAVTAHGLGLLTGAIVEQHFAGRGGRLERFTGLLRNTTLLDRLSGRKGAGSQMIGLAVEENTALIAQGSRIQVTGAGSAHVFLKSAGGRTIVWHELLSGEHAQLKYESPGTVAVKREEAVLTR